MKKNYQKPAMKVVQLQHRNHILAGSDTQGAKSVTGSGFSKKSGGFEDGEEDM